MKTNNFYLSVLIFLVVLFFVAPVMAREARLRVSDLENSDILKNDLKAEIKFGRDLAARILASHPLVEDPTIQYYINLVGNSVAMSAGRPELQFYFGVIESDEVNAFAIPGGYIFITTAAVRHLNNEAELAGVLGHEIGHIISKHIVKELKIRGEDGSAMAGFSAIIGGTTASIRETFDQVLDKATDILFHRGYKMADELEADQIGIILSAFAGYDPSALKNFIMRVKHFEKPSSDYSGDHPAYKVRVDAISEALKANNVNPIHYSRGEKRFNENLAD